MTTLNTLIYIAKNPKNWNIFSIWLSANPVMEIQPQTLMLGSNMSSGVTVPNFGKKFAKLRQCEQFEVQENSSENKAPV